MDDYKTEDQDLRFSDEFSEAYNSDVDHISMADLDLSSRPREKMLRFGPSALSRAELLAILIGSGSPEKNAVELMQEILGDNGGRLMLLDQLSIEQLMKYKGIGEAKAVTLKAALALSQYRLTETMSDSKQFRSSSDIVKFMRVKLWNLPYEESWALMLNNNAVLLRLVKLSQGGRVGTVVDIRILLKEAIMSNATSVILVHNHPSGSLRPSRDDDSLTQAAKTGLNAVDIRLLDHLIITDGGYYSYNESGRL